MEAKGEIHTEDNRRKYKNPVEIRRATIISYNNTHLLNSYYCFGLRKMIASNLTLLLSRMSH